MRKPSALALSMVTLVAGVVLAGVTSAAAPRPAAAGYTWIRDYDDDFTTPQDDHRWGRYGWGNQPVGNGAMGLYSPYDVYNHDGVMALRTLYENGQWTSAGVSGNPSFSAAGGKWEVRARMPQAKGIGYCFLLYPADNSWPPEVDLAEGRVNGRVESTYHWGTPDQNFQSHSVNANIDTHQWHTYGVILGQNQIIFTIDGDNVTGVLDNVPVTDKKLWLGMQTGAMDPNGSARDYETVDGGVPNALTPASTELQIDWVAHYHL